MQQVQKQTGQMQERTIIDGQQRLTTLQLLLDALHAELLTVGVGLTSIHRPVTRQLSACPRFQGSDSLPSLESFTNKNRIPAHFFRTHTAPRPVHPRALREASLSGTGERWPRTGATRTPNARRSKPQCPGATSWHHRVLGGRCRNSEPTARRLQRLIAVVRKPQTTGGVAEQTSNTARGTLERRRTCGFFSGISAGPLDLAASRAPSDLFSERASAE